MYETMYVDDIELKIRKFDLTWKFENLKSWKNKAKYYFNTSNKS